MAWVMMFAAEYMRSTGVVSGVIGRFMEDCLQRIKTRWILVRKADIEASYKGLTRSPALTADIGASVPGTTPPPPCSIACGGAS